MKCADYIPLFIPALPLQKDQFASIVKPNVQSLTVINTF